MEAFESRWWAGLGGPGVGPGCGAGRGPACGVWVVVSLLRLPAVILTAELRGSALACD